MVIGIHQQNTFFAEVGALVARQSNACACCKQTEKQCCFHDAERQDYAAGLLQTATFIAQEYLNRVSV